MKQINLFTDVFAISLLLAACGGDSVLNDPAANSRTSLSETEIEGLLYMREEEELARDLYLDIYAAKGNRLTTFKNIPQNAETQHAEAMRLLLEKYDIEDPSTGVHSTYTDVELQNVYT